MADLPSPPSDPCAEAERLQGILVELATGGGVKRVRYKNGDEERETEFSAANIPALQALIMDARARCQLKDPNARPRRFAITAGARFTGRTIY